MQITNPPVKITDELWMLGTAAYPLYLVQGGGEATVFEGGVGAMGPLLMEQFKQIGVAPESVSQIVVTHAHPDHVMAVPLLRVACGDATVIASAIAAKTLTIEKAVAFFGKIDGALTSSLLAAGLITDAHKPAPPTEAQIAVDRTVADGDTISVGAAAFTVLATPGHSDCSLSFHEAEQGILLISDATGYYLPADNSWWPNYFSGYEAYLSSIRRLAGLAARVLCLSHNAAITGEAEVAAYFDGAIRATEAYHQRIVDELQAGADPRELAGRLGTEIHAKTPLLPVDFFQKNCSLLVKQSMAHAGIAPPEQA